MKNDTEVERGRAAYESKMRSVYRYRPPLDDTPPHGTDEQPVTHIEWVPAADLRANDYNPNFVAPPELKLLKVSMLADGWTQPIVTRDDGEEIVDGFHRWLLAGDPVVRQMTGGLVPIAKVRDVPRERQMMSTIRHNRARGSHHVLRMADLVTTMLEAGVDAEKISDLLGMEDEEVSRMSDHGNMIKRGSADEFNKGWVPR